MSIPTGEIRKVKNLGVFNISAFFSVFAFGEFLRGSVAVAEVVGIAQATFASGGNHQLLAVVDEIPQQQVGAQITHFGAAGHADQQRVGARSSGAVGSAAATIVGLKQALVFETNA